MIIDGVETREVPGFDGLFWAARDGRIAGRRNKKGWLKPQLERNGYYRVATGKGDGKIRKVLVHRAVLLAWDPHPEADRMHVHHRDFDRSNNNFDNLEWVTSAQNNTYSEEAGRHSIAGVKNPKASVTEDQVREIRRLHSEGVSISDLTEQFPCNWCSIWRIVTRRSWKSVA